MYDGFDAALKRALNSENAMYGLSERSAAAAAARRAARENRVKALNEASMGEGAFAKLHETASTRYHEDAEEMAKGRAPRHHSIGFYLATAAAYRRADQKERAAAAAVPEPRRAVA